MNHTTNNEFGAWQSGVRYAYDNLFLLTTGLPSFISLVNSMIPLFVFMFCNLDQMLMIKLYCNQQCKLYCRVKQSMSPVVYNFINSVQSIFVENLLCPRHCARSREHAKISRKASDLHRQCNSHVVQLQA